MLVVSVERVKDKEKELTPMPVKTLALSLGRAALFMGLSLEPALEVLPGSGPVRRTFVDLEPTHVFSPSVISIHVGEEVTWRNKDSISLAVVGDPLRAKFSVDVEPPAPPEPFHSEAIPPAGSFSRRFMMEGVYRYVSDVYEDEGMNGIVIVTAAPLSMPFSPRRRR